MIRAMDAAKYILYLGKHNQVAVNPITLQYLLYFAQLLSFEDTGKALFYDSEIEAWDFGPCVPVVYYRYCHFGVSDICLLLGDIERPNIPLQAMSILEEVFEDKADIPYFSLIKEIQQQGTPYQKAYIPHKNKIIRLSRRRQENEKR